MNQYPRFRRFGTPSLDETVATLDEMVPPKHIKALLFNHLDSL